MADTTYDPQAAESELLHLESATGVKRDKFGDLSKKSPEEIAYLRKLMARIGNQEQGAAEEGLKYENPFVQQTAKAYLSGRGSQGYDEAAWNAYQKATAAKDRESQLSIAVGAAQKKYGGQNVRWSGNGNIEVFRNDPSYPRWELVGNAFEKYDFSGEDTWAPPKREYVASDASSTPPASAGEWEAKGPPPAAAQYVSSSQVAQPSFAQPSFAQPAVAAPAYTPQYVTPQFYTPQAVAERLGTKAPAAPTAPAATDNTTKLLEEAITSMLSGKGGYSQELLDKLRQTGRGELQAQYEEAARQLEGEMARRGIAASSIALERSSGLKGSNQRALASFETELAKQVEDAMRSDRQAGLQSALTLRGQQTQEGQFAQQFAESQRQWDANFGLNVAQFNQQAAQWAATYNLDQNRFSEAVRQFNVNLAEQQRQFGMNYDLNSRQFEEQAKQFALSFGLDQQKFTEAVRQFNESQRVQQDQFRQSLSTSQNQFDKTFGLDQQKFAEAQKQFQASLELQRTQIITQIITGLQGKVDQAVLEAILRGFGIDPSKYFGTPKGQDTTSPNGRPTNNGPTGSPSSDNASANPPTNIGAYNGEMQTVNGVSWYWDAGTQTWRRAN